jgi:hypothetical protein
VPVWNWGLASECSGLVMDIIAGCSTYLSRTSVISGRSQATLLMSPYRTITSWQIGTSRSDTLLQPNLNLHAVTGITGRLLQVTPGYSRLLQDSAIALFWLQNQHFPAYYVRALQIWPITKLFLHKIVTSQYYRIELTHYHSTKRGLAISTNHRTLVQSSDTSTHFFPLSAHFSNKWTKQLHIAVQNVIIVTAKCSIFIRKYEINPCEILERFTGVWKCIHSLL